MVSKKNEKKLKKVVDIPKRKQYYEQAVAGKDKNERQQSDAFLFLKITYFKGKRNVL